MFSSIDHFDALVNLEELSLEDNLIQQLSGLEALLSLAELYLANNLFAVLSYILSLKNLSSLLICDLSGNPVTQVCA